MPTVPPLVLGVAGATVKASPQYKQASPHASKASKPASELPVHHAYPPGSTPVGDTPKAAHHEEPLKGPPPLSYAGRAENPMTAEASDHVLRFLGPVSAPAFSRTPLVSDVSRRGRCAFRRPPPVSVHSGVSRCNLQVRRSTYHLRSGLPVGPGFPDPRWRAAATCDTCRR